MHYNPGSAFPKDVDIIVGGGGQDSGQDKVQADLQKIAPQLQLLADADVPMLLICGLYQLFGNYFKTQDGHVIDGIGILDIETIAGSERMIGNIITDSSEFGRIVGFENHSGLTYLRKGVEPFAKVIRGGGNNNQDKSEGARYRNVIGTYLHGSLLPKNPQIADWMLQIAITKKFGSFTPKPIDDSIADLARQHAFKRPR
jgi:CobQ-like glutamine amidotransferase family enzyme